MKIHHHQVKEREKRYWRHFWYVYDNDEKQSHGEFSVELAAFRKGHGLGAGFDVDTATVKCWVHCGHLFSSWMRVESWPHLRKATEKVIGKEYPRDREVSVWLHDDLLSLCLWRPENHHKSGDRRNILWNWKRWLCGKQVVDSQVAETRGATVLMPERAYSATVEIKQVTHSWPRFKRKRQFIFAKIAVPGGIPEPGKGENSWDCDDDATFALSCRIPDNVSWDEIGDYVVAEITNSVTKRRLRYGGQGWTAKP